MQAQSTDTMTSEQRDLVKLIRSVNRGMDCTDRASIVRKLLKHKWPTVKFSVRSSRFSMGSAVQVSYKDGPPQGAVEAIAEIVDRIDRDHTGEILSGGNCYVSASRHVSTELQAAVEAFVDTTWVRANWQPMHERQTQVWRVLEQSDLAQVPHPDYTFTESEILA